MKRVLSLTMAFVLLLSGAAAAYKVVPPDNLLGAKAVKDGQIPLQKKVRRIAPNPRLAGDDKPRTFQEGCVAWQKMVRLPRCAYGVPRSDKRVVLLGDSKAMQFFPALEKVALQRNWKLVNLIRVNCTPALVVVEDANCNRWRNNILRRITKKEKPYLVIISSAVKGSYKVKSRGQVLSREASQPYLHKGMVETIRQLQLAGAEVVVLRDSSIAPFRPSECVVKNHHRLQRCAWKPRRNQSRSFDVSAASWTGAKILDPQRAYCNAEVCPAVLGNMAVYLDSYHITATFAATLDEWFMSRLPEL